ncbi:MAG: T9SS type A sorting domain-containing protein, partial [candidate division KSB1 bacterium]|nr:T9SS type A sorting domain-containing protein [candidate division KSB1 bacterium]
ANTGWAVGARNTIIKTTNGGTTWTPQTSGITTSSPTLNAVHFIDANTGWIVAVGGTIQKTTNGGDTWSVLNLPTPSLNAIYFMDSENGWGAGVIGAILKFSSGTTAVSERTVVRLPEQYILQQNYPNPFNPSTVISFQLPVNSHVTLKVFDVNGREVATLVEGEMAAGSHSVTFAPRDLAGGIYFYKLTAGRFSQTRKAILMR